MTYPRPNVAVAFHCYHSDIAPEILAKLLCFPFTFDLFVTTPNEEMADFISRFVAAIPLLGECLIGITPNLGRNFGPMLVEFGSELQAYPIMCHIHTKKSLHGQGFAGWGAYLIENIIGTPDLVRSIVQLFDFDTKCGLIYPTRFSKIPAWSQNWLGNFAIADHWCRLNELSIVNGQVDFPTGGMFWARPSAIRQLLRFNWSYADFPPESGQIDGTMHHAVERIVGAATIHNGFDHWIYKPEENSFLKLGYL